MAFDVINNGEDGLVVRDKLNDNFAKAVETTDPRLGSVDLSGLPLAGALTGTEINFVSRAGVGLQSTTQDAAGTPLTMARTLAKNRFLGYSDFSKFRTSGFTATNGGLLELEPYVTNFSGDASVTNLVGIVGSPGLYLQTGTGASNYYSITSLEGGPIVFNPAFSFEQTISLNIPVLSATGEKFAVEYGFTALPTSVALPIGIYFYVDPDVAAASSKWLGRVKNAGGTSPLDTLIPVVAGAQTVVKVRYDATTQECQFFVNGVYGGSITNATRVIATNTVLYMTCTLRKTVGTTARALGVGNHAFDSVSVIPVPAGY